MTKSIKLAAAVFLLLAMTKKHPINETAAQSLGIASTYAVHDQNAVDGDLVCFSEKDGKLERCDRPYAESMFGVLMSKSQIILRQNSIDKPVIREGHAFVNATAANGSINIGDSLTSSNTPGRAQKATEPIGFILGRALSPLGSGTGQIEAVISIGPQGILPRGTIFEKLGYILVKGTQTPQAAGLFLRYIVGGITTTVITLFALNHFGQNISQGIISIGRNPLAKSHIHFAIIVNTFLILALVIGAIILGLAIIRL